MNKHFLTAFCLYISFGSLGAFEKLDPKYQIQYGNPDSSIKIVEYFSLSCPKCFEFFHEDFPSIKQKYLDTKNVSWSFHPDPADLLTLQAMVCLEHLPEAQKRLFLETILKHLGEKNTKHGSFVMQAAMEILNHPLPALSQIEFLEKSEAFQQAFLFLKQPDVVKSIPMVEINGVLQEEYPTKELLGETIESLMNQRFS
jgi:hypothetical protein